MCVWGVFGVGGSMSRVNARSCAWVVWGVLGGEGGLRSAGETAK